MGSFFVDGGPLIGVQNETISFLLGEIYTRQARCETLANCMQETDRKFGEFVSWSFSALSEEYSPAAPPAVAKPTVINIADALGLDGTVKQLEMKVESLRRSLGTAVQASLDKRLGPRRMPGEQTASPQGLSRSARRANIVRE